MGWVRRMRNRWRNRRLDLAMKQVEADRAVGDLDASSTGGDVFAGKHYAHQRSLSGFLNPKAKTRTEWRGD